MNIYCLPFAGGAGYSYDLFRKNAPSSLRFVTLELPGRGNRINEPLLTDIPAIVEDVWRQLKSFNLEEPYAIYGHSLGGLLTYLLTHRILAEGKPVPLHLFFSGCYPPSRISFRKKRHLLSDDDLIRELKDMGGSPSEILEDYDLMQFFLPIIRADFRAIELYRHTSYEPFEIPITVFLGDEEDEIGKEADGWSEVTLATQEVVKMPGAHFFIYDNCEQILDIITQKISVLS